MNLSEAAADYLIELFNVGLEEVAERVAVITEHSVSLSMPVLLEQGGMQQLACNINVDASDQGSLTTLPLSGGFDGFGMMFIAAPQDAAFAELLAGAHGQEQQNIDKALQELSRVLLEQYVVVMTDLLNLTIDYGEIDFERTSLAQHSGLAQACEDGSLCLTMTFVLNDLAIPSHIIFVHRPQMNELVNTIDTALTKLGLN